MVFSAFWPFAESLGYEPAKIKRSVTDAIIMVVMAARSQLLERTKARCPSELFEFNILLDADGLIHLLGVTPSPQIDAGATPSLAGDLLNLTLIPKQNAFADRIEEAFVKKEKRELAAFITVVESEMSELQRGAFRRVYPTSDAVSAFEKIFTAATPFDKHLADYVVMEREQKEDYFRQQVPEFDDFIEDLLDCDNQRPACQVA
jgi:hypothetical protein